MSKLTKITHSGSPFICSLIMTLLISATGQSDPVFVGDTRVEIPDPPGFSPVIPQMKALWEFQKSTVPSTNERLLSYLPESEVMKALNDEMPTLERRLSVQTAKSVIGVFVAKSEFLHLKQTCRTQYEETTGELKETLDRQMENVNERVMEQSGINLALSLLQVVPLPLHQETDRTLAYSQFVKYEVHDEAGNPASFVGVVTTTLVHVRGKVLFLYSTAEESGLEWSREIAEQWANSILLANPPSVKESLPPVVRDMDWGRIAAKGVGGVIFVVVLGAIGLLRNCGGTEDEDGSVHRQNSEKAINNGSIEHDQIPQDEQNPVT